MFEYKKLDNLSMKEKNAVYNVILLVWLLYTALQCFVMYLSNNIVLDFYWGKFNYYILLIAAAIILWIKVGLSKREGLRLMKSITLGILSLVLFLMFTNAIYNIYSTVTYYKSASITSIDDSKVIAIEELDNIAPSNGTYEVIEDTYRKKKSLLIPEFYETKESILYSDNSKTSTTTDKYISFEMKYYRVASDTMASVLFKSIVNTSISNDMFFVLPENILHIKKSYVETNNKELVEMITLYKESTDKYSHFYIWDNVVIQVNHNGVINNELIKDIVMNKFIK